MTGPLLTRLARGAAALVVLLVLVVGVPIGLHTLGAGPRPVHIPTLAELRSLLARPDDGTILLTATAVIAWLAWAGFVAGLLVEVAATVRSRPARGLPGLAVLQRPAAALVTALATSLTAPALAPLAAVAAPPAAQTRSASPANPALSDVLSNAILPRQAGSALVESTLSTRDGQPATPVRYTVRPRDSAWRIAERHLGDGRRWRELWQLNRGLPQPGGQAWTEPDHIEEGWSLLLPADAADSTDRQVVVQPGDTLSEIARMQLGDPTRYPEILAVNRGRRQPDGSAFTDPSRILPGLVLTLPATPGRHPSRQAPATSPDHPRTPRPHPGTSGPPTTVSLPPRMPPAPTTSTPPKAPDPPARPPAAGHPAVPSAHGGPELNGHPRQANTPSWIAGATLLATATTGLWAYRRRRRDNKIRLRQSRPVTNPALARLNTSLGHAADTDGIARLDTALRSLAALHTAPGGPTPQVLLRTTDGTIDVYLAHPITPAQPPWTADADGRIWTLLAAARLDRAEMPAPCPALIQLGTASDGAELYIDLEAIGILTIDAGGAELRAVARAVTATLAVTPLADLPTVHTHGFDPYGLAQEERLTTHATPDNLLAAVAADSTHVQAALGKTGLASTLQLRARHPEDGCDPTIGVLAANLTSPAAKQLAELAGDGGRGLAVIGPTHPDLSARWRLVPDPAGPKPGWRLDPLGMQLTPIQLAADELADLAELLTEAEAISTDPTELARPDPLAPVELPTASSRGNDHSSAAEPSREPDWQVMIRLLGPVDVITRDGARPTGAVRERTLEVLAWLATHRITGTRLDLETAIWANGAHPDTVSNELGRARRILTQLAGPHAREWIPTRQATLSLHPAVISDLDLLQARLRHAERQHEPDAAIPILQAALDLVRGIPARYPWLTAETGSTLSLAPVTAAIRLAERLLARKEFERVLEATTRGLAVLPAHTELFALRLRAHAARADRTALKAEYHAYLEAESADPLWDGETDRDLEQLYLGLLRRQARHANAG